MRRVLVIVCLAMLVASVAVPAISGLSPWQLRGGRTRHAEEAATGLGAPLVSERDLAERHLVDLGSAALPVLDDLPQNLPAEVLLRARRAVSTIRSDAGEDRRSDLDRLDRALRKAERPPTDVLLRLGADALPGLVTAMHRHRHDPDLLHLTVDHAIRCGGPVAAGILGRIIAAADVPAAAIHRAAGALAADPTTPDLPALRLLLDDPSSARRAAAVRVLLAHGALTDRDALRRAIRDASPSVRRECAPLLADARTRHLAVALLADPETSVRVRAVDTLGGVRDPDAVAALRDRLADPSHRVRAAAVSGLAAGGHTRGLAALAGDASCGVRLAVRRAIHIP